MSAGVAGKVTVKAPEDVSQIYAPPSVATKVDVLFSQAIPVAEAHSGSALAPLVTKAYPLVPAANL